MIRRFVTVYENDVYYRTSDAARYIGVTDLTIRNWIHKGVFKSVRLEETCGHGGRRAYEIAKSELDVVKAQWEAKKQGKIVEITVEHVVDKKVDTTNDDVARRKAEVRLALHNLQECIKLLSGCIEDLVETMI